MGGKIDALLDMVGLFAAVVVSIICFYFLNFFDALTVVAVVAFVGLALWYTSADAKMKIEIAGIDRSIKVHQDLLNKLMKSE